MVNAGKPEITLSASEVAVDLNSSSNDWNKIEKHRTVIIYTVTLDADLHFSIKLFTCMLSITVS